MLGLFGVHLSTRRAENKIYDRNLSEATEHECCPHVQDFDENIFDDILQSHNIVIAIAASIVGSKKYRNREFDQLSGREEVRRERAQSRRGDYCQAVYQWRR